MRVFDGESRTRRKSWACKAMAEGESWSGWNQVKEQAQNVNQGDWKKPTRGVDREEWEVRQDFANNEGVCWKMLFRFLAKKAIEWRWN